jgi:hypothetical protein
LAVDLRADWYGIIRRPACLRIAARQLELCDFVAAGAGVRWRDAQRKRGHEEAAAIIDSLLCSPSLQEQKCRS